MGAMISLKRAGAASLMRLVLPLVFACALAAPALADPIPAGEIRMDGLRSRFNVVGGGAVAGEFVVNASRLNFTPQGLGRYGAAPDQFISFCVETTEYIQLNRWYTAELNTQSRATNQPLRSETAFLYTQFTQGTLSDYKYFDSGAGDAAKVASARALQEMIWYYQDPSGFAARYGANAFGTGGYFLGSGAHKVLARQWYQEVNDALDGNQWSGIGKVRILNIWDGSLGRQDTLTLIPLPAPIWLGGVGLGLTGFVVSRRRRPAPWKASRL